MLFYIFKLSLKQSCAVVFDAQATTAQLHPGRDTFEFNQRHVTKNQTITVLVLLSESLVNNNIVCTTSENLSIDKPNNFYGIA